ncbi:hypothetical protein AB0L70_29415 [Kribbella sp. NPDC051952]|uniref:hypothetical protein n=1 Tax=Kribbella sp. NPDC051952 TaxID=3154851 RepID=UPI003448188C
MLASLLPGLRDVRTPLAVGSLWFFSAWMFFADRLTDHLPSDSSLVANLLELSDFFGTGATLAAISFAAFLLGSVVTFDPDSRPVRVVGTWIALRKRLDVSIELMDFLDKELTKYGQLRNHPEATFDQLLPADDLRARLLAASHEMYSEYDRLDAEASFRVNVPLPMVAFAIALYVTGPDSIWPNRLAALALATMAVVMLAQGVHKHRLSRGVLMRAVLAGIIEHPAVARARLSSDESTAADQRDDGDGEVLRNYVQRTLAELSSAHSMKADADEKDDAAVAREWRIEIKTLEDRLLAVFDAD